MIWQEGQPRTFFERITKENIPCLVSKEYFLLDAVRRVMLEKYEATRAAEIADMFLRNCTWFEKYDQLHWAENSNTPEKIMNKIDSIKDPGRFRFSLLNSSGAVAGYFNFEILDEASDTAIYGYGLDEKHLGFGYATRALKLAVEFTTTHMHVKNHLAYIHDENLASQRIAERVGFKFLVHDDSMPQFRLYELHKS